MTQRAFVIEYQRPSTDMSNPNGSILFGALCVYTDSVNPLKNTISDVNIILDANAPAGWNASIKAQIQADAIAFGFSTILTTGIYIPTYA